MNKNFIKIFFIVCLITLAAVLYLKRYNYLLSNLHQYKKLNSNSYKEPSFPKLTRDQILTLGWALRQSNAGKTSYITYPENKSQGVKRIGIFGGSFEAGVEVARGHDFPSLLQDKFDKEGIKNVEVINFAVGGYGMHQAYLLSRLLGKKYDLDYFVFFLNTVDRGRDKNFGKIRAYDQLHARYVIKRNKIELVLPVGKSIIERARIYHRIFPPWRYIRYETIIPLFLQAILPSSWHDKFNPFYYRLWKANEEEALTGYTLLFNKLSEENSHIIIASRNENVIDQLKEELPFSNISLMGYRIPFVNSLYFATKGHNSALGNQLRAYNLFSFLMGHDNTQIDILDLSYDIDYKEKGSETLFRPLFEYSEVFAVIGEDSVASFVEKLSERYPYRVEETDFKENKISSVLLLPNSDKGKGVFLQLSFLLKDKEEIFLSFVLNGAAVRVPIGSISAPIGIIGKITLGMTGPNVTLQRGKNWKVEIKSDVIFLHVDGVIKNLSIMCGDKEIFRKDIAFVERVKGYISGRMSILAEINSSSASFLGAAELRAKEGQFVDIDNINAEGTMDIVLKDKDGNQLRYPIALYRRKEISIDEFSRPCSKPIFR